MLGVFIVDATLTLLRRLIRGEKVYEAHRSHAYQLGIFRRKLARGQRLEDILAVNAAPGYSEHHGGRALDIGTPGEPPAEESFEATPEFDWLTAKAARFGFSMSYPRGNPHGIVYEPWHGYHLGRDGGADPDAGGAQRRRGGTPGRGPA